MEKHPNLVLTESQDQRSDSKKRPGASSPAKQAPGRAGTGTPSHSANMSGKQKKQSRRSGFDVDPDLKSSETESSRATSHQTLRLPTTRSQPRLVAPASQAGYGTPAQRSVAATL